MEIVVVFLFGIGAGASLVAAFNAHQDGLKGWLTVQLIMVFIAFGLFLSVAL